MSAVPSTIALSLISHTNTGKTALARTLLGRDVGEVRDAPHVTLAAEPYTLIETREGDVLQLWDTPGFGDSARLARRLAQQANPIGWFVMQVWDRWRDRPLWLSQHAVRNVRDRADVVLYLVNAAEAPADAGYLEHELQVLDWIAKPVVVLLNQTGRPRPDAEEVRDEALWRAAVGARPLIRAVLSLDAFARCWVQEIVLLRVVGDALPADRAEAFVRLQAAWQARRLEQFDASMEALAGPIARAALDRGIAPEPALHERTRDLLQRVLSRGSEVDPSSAAAMSVMARRLDDDIRAGTDRLIAIHELAGSAAHEVLEQLADNVTRQAPLSEGKSALVGGFVSGALTGLVADIASGGLSLGAGMLAGGLLGALGGAGVARGVNVSRGVKETVVRWSEPFLDNLVAGGLLRYLAVAHYGRGRGEWQASGYPAFWREAVANEMKKRKAELALMWTLRPENDLQALETAARRELSALARAVLDTLYPGALRP